ncbi:SLAM family member 9-like [Siphateles boraxobius]|uniref:SLAM family member 9-like n=1 Tax=Siphateles boraxobius TaxID=180520 RepID=UPI004062A599
MKKCERRDSVVFHEIDHSFFFRHCVRNYLKRWKKMIHAIVLFCLFCFPLIGAVTDTMAVMEGDFFILHTGLAGLQSVDKVEWRFGSSRTLIASIANGSIEYGGDKRFRDRLQLERRTGDLTITNVSNEHSGVYKRSITIGLKEPTEEIHVTVYPHLPVPVITKYSPQCSSSSSVSKSVLLCSVLNVSHVTLSWYKATSLLSNISVSDLSISLSLPLEVEYQDKDTYSCLLNNPVSNQTTHLDINTLCHTSDHWSQRTEAMIRLVVTAVMGVAAVAAVVVLVYDIRSRRVELERKTKFIEQ